jgi:hypothetical protein
VDTGDGGFAADAFQVSQDWKASVGRWIRLGHRGQASQQGETKAKAEGA